MSENGTIQQEMHDDTGGVDVEKSLLPEKSLTTEENESTIPIEESVSSPLIYTVNTNPPIHVIIVCALQQSLLSISSHLIGSLLVAEAVCASHNEMIKARLLSSTLMITGVTTLAMNLIRIRLPLFQGASPMYIIPLLMIGETDSTFCTSSDKAASLNTSSNVTSMAAESDETILNNLRALQGSLMIVGVIHALVGMTGIVGIVLRFIGPLTIVPTMTLLFIFLVKTCLKYVQVNWGISMSTVGVAVILFLYLEKYQMPVPVWTPSKGFRTIRYPVQQVFAILISIILNWTLCAILTMTGSLTDDPKSNGYLARTDARASIIYDSPWVTFPYPGQWGQIGFSDTAFVTFLIATILSIIDSIGDYYACSRVCRVPIPPVHGVNRGLLIEGLCTILAGGIGSGHGTSTYGGNIGAIGVTKVASRRVFIFAGILYILFAVFGKFCGVFITIPHPVLGGAIVVMFGIFFGVVLSNLEVINMSSSRNVAIIGLAVFIGLMIPTWAQATANPVNTGLAGFDRIVGVVLKNPNFMGLVIAFFLDNTVPGSLKDRGITAWTAPKGEELSEDDRKKYLEGYEVYSPLLPQRVLHWNIMRYIPFLPYRGAMHKQQKGV